MKCILPDANVFLSFFTDRDRNQQAEAAGLFPLAGRQEAQVLLHQNVLVETVYVLSNLYREPRAKVAGLLRDLLDFPGVKPVQDLDWNEVLRLWPSLIPDFGDAILAGVSKALKACLFTFDRDLLKRLRKLGVRCAGSLDRA